MIVVSCANCGAKNRVDERLVANLQPKCGRCGSALSILSPAVNAEPLTITDDSLQDLLKRAGEKPLLVDCWAEWCPPCRMLAPVIDQIAAESNGRWLVGKLDSDSNPQTASRFKIEALPTLLIFRRGQVVDRLVGLQPKPSILARLQAHSS